MAQGDPLPGVDISIEQSPGGKVIARARTGVDGTYAFENVPAGTYRIVVSVEAMQRGSERGGRTPTQPAPPERRNG
jgi:hypothetical protein